ncbi:hypothetical protein C8J56DRAFT_884622 [Mycena floridula]|nr:hypothetical protein C8J56DRAFT_884622 [Mycena floridula]
MSIFGFATAGWLQPGTGGQTKKMHFDPRRNLPDSTDGIGRGRTNIEHYFPFEACLYWYLATLSIWGQKYLSAVLRDEEVVEILLTLLSVPPIIQSPQGPYFGLRHSQIIYLAGSEILKYKGYKAYTCGSTGIQRRLT